LSKRRPPIAPTIEQCEDRTLTALVFVLNGNSFNAAKPSILTANAAAVIRQAGDQVVQLSNARINSTAAFKMLSAAVTRMAHGQSIGLVGFSAGGALALHIAATPGLKVSAALDYYGVPDIRAFLQRHVQDHFYRPIAGLSPFRPAIVSLLSGPMPTQPHVVAAFGEFDPHVRADTSASDLLHDDPDADVYTYADGHGVSITASRPALNDFLAHLTASP
jgi:dienelactone hydrolase